MIPIHILLVEDDELDVIDIQRTLDKLQIYYQLHHARNGEEAIKILQETTDLVTVPYVLLIDINMPKMNGIELLTEIRRNEMWKHLKCFIVTTSNEKADRKNVDKLGVSGYIIKPLKLNSPSTMDAFNLMIDLLNFKSYE